MGDLMKGKRGLVMGVANDHSIAWGIAKAVAEQGAELAFSYQGEAFGKRVKPLADKVNASLLLPCDVEDIATVDAMFDTIKEKWGSLDFVVHAIGFSDKNELKGLYADTTRDNFVRTMVISCFSFTEISKRAAALMGDKGSLLTLTYGGATRSMPNYNVMGVAKAGLENAGRCRYQRCTRHAQLAAAQLADAPHGNDRGCGQFRFVSAFRSVEWRDRRNPLCRFRIQHDLNAISGRAQRAFGISGSSFIDRHRETPHPTPLCTLLT